MMFIGAMHYYFWEGIKAAICGLDDDPDIGPTLGTKTTENCLQAYLDGYALGLELTPKEYMEMVL